MSGIQLVFHLDSPVHEVTKKVKQLNFRDFFLIFQLLIYFCLHFFPSSHRVREIVP